MSYRITIPRKITTVLDFDGDNFILHAPFSKDSWIGDLAAGSWDKKLSFWKLPPYLIYAQTVVEQLPDLEISEAASDALSMSDELAAEPVGGGWDPILKLVYQQLYWFQRQAVYRLIHGPHTTSLIALSPGLGKTVVALTAARLLGLKKVLIVAPKSLLRSWENEEDKWFGDTAMERRHGLPPSEQWWTLTNYDTVVDKVVVDKRGKVVDLGPRLKQYMAVDWDLVILDESVLVKNRHSHRYLGLLELRKAFPKKQKHWWELSGYPVTKYADDLWAQLHLQDPRGFNSYWRFTNRVCYVTQDVWGTEVTGTRQNVDIIGNLKDVMFVRNQKDVLDQLPEEIPQLIEVELRPKQLKAYDEMATDFITTLESGREIKAPIVLSQLIRLQQITSNLVNIAGPGDEPKKGTKYIDPNDESIKADVIVELYETRAFDTPTIIWTQWLPGADALWRRLSESARKHKDDRHRIEWIHGATSKRDDADNEEKFEAYKAGNIDILILAMPVGKMGHNLQMTHTVIYHDKTWFADDYVQSMRRVKRMGLDHRPVVITIKAVGTVDQLVEDNLSGKFPGISKVSNDDLATMLRHLRGGQA
jgi:SNF2 family DNA or RNA helicase